MPTVLCVAQPGQVEVVQGAFCPGGSLRPGSQGRYCRRGRVVFFSPGGSRVGSIARQCSKRLKVRAKTRPFKIWISGTLYAKEDAKISVYDHGLLYGDGVFEGAPQLQRQVFRLDEHLDRLWNSAKAILLEIPISREVMARAIADTLAANNPQDAYIRLIAARGQPGLDPAAPRIRK